MKKIVFCLILACGLLFLASCDSNEEYEFDTTCYSVFTAQKSADGVWYFVDDSEKFTYLPNETVELNDTMVGHRFYVNFSYVEVKNDSVYNMALNYVVPVEMLSFNAVESFDDVQRLCKSAFTLNDAWATYKYANFVVDFYGSDLDKHHFSLARIDTAAVVDSVATIYLCHDAGTDSGTSSFTSVFSADISEFAANKGIKSLRVVYTNSGGFTIERLLTVYRY